MMTPGDDSGARVNEWLNVVRRARLPAEAKLIALLLASYADPDGTRIYPGVARLAVQSDQGYRTVQRHLQRLRKAGLIEELPRRHVPRHFSTGYRLILADDVTDRIDVPSPAAEDAAIEKVKSRFRGRHKPTARHDGGAQTDDCTSPGDTTARQAPPDNHDEQHPTLHRPLHKTNPPYADADIRSSRTGDARAREGNDCTPPSPSPDTRTRRGTAEAARAQSDALTEWERRQPPPIVNSVPLIRRELQAGAEIAPEDKPDNLIDGLLDAIAQQ